MFLYLFLTLLISYLFYEKKFVRNTSIALFFIGLMYVMFFRYGLGVDYFSYKAIYESMSNTSFTVTRQLYDTIEVGYLILSLIAKNIGMNFHVFSVLLSFVITISYFYWLNLYTTDKEFILSLLIYVSMFFIVWSLSAFRQGLVMAILLLTIFNPKYRIPFWKKTIIILLMSTIHYSSLIAFAYVLLEKIITTKKRLIGYLIFSVFIAIILTVISPLLLEIEIVRNIKYLSKALTYFTVDSISWVSICVRMFFLLYLLPFYDLFSRYKSDVLPILNYYLIGTGIYTMTSFSSIVSARLSIYSYIMIPLLLAISISLLNEIKIIKFDKSIVNIIGVTFVISLSSVFLVKEVKAYNLQSGYMGNIILENIPNVFDKRPNEFESRYALIEKMKMDSTSLEENLNKVFDDYVYSENDSFTSVKYSGKNLFGVINQEGVPVEEARWFYQPNVFGFMYEYYLNEDYNSRYVYSSINPNYEGSKIDYVNNLKAEETNIRIQTIYKKNLFNETDHIYQNIKEFLKEEGIMDFNIDQQLTYTRPFKYSVVKLNVYDYPVYVLLNSNERVVSKMLYNSISTYDVNGFIRLEVDGKKHVYNRNGEIIWGGE